MSLERRALAPLHAGRVSTRAFTHGHVRELHAVSREFLVQLALFAALNVATEQVTADCYPAEPARRPWRSCVRPLTHHAGKQIYVDSCWPATSAEHLVLSYKCGMVVDLLHSLRARCAGPCASESISVALVGIALLNVLTP